MQRLIKNLNFIWNKFKKSNEQFWEEVEEQLILNDVGPKTASLILNDIKNLTFSDNINDIDKIIFYFDLNTKNGLKIKFDFNLYLVYFFWNYIFNFEGIRFWEKSLFLLILLCSQRLNGAFKLNSALHGFLARISKILKSNFMKTLTPGPSPRGRGECFVFQQSQVYPSSTFHPILPLSWQERGWGELFSFISQYFFDFTHFAFTPLKRLKINKTNF